MNRLLLLIALVGISSVFGCSSKPSGGGCGCKARARGVLKLDGDNAVDQDFGYVEGLSLWANPKPPADVSVKEAMDPNVHFKRCCVGRGLSDACSAHCNYDSYNQDLLQKMLIGADACPLDSLSEMHFCAAQGRDHSTCCQQRGVADTSAGDKCLVFCDQVPDKFTPIDYTYAACFGKFDEMKTCFYGTIASKAKAYFTHH